MHGRAVVPKDREGLSERSVKAMPGLPLTRTVLQHAGSLWTAGTIFDMCILVSYTTGQNSTANGCKATSTVLLLGFRLLATKVPSLVGF